MIFQIDRAEQRDIVLLTSSWNGITLSLWIIVFCIVGRYSLNKVISMSVLNICFFSLCCLFMVLAMGCSVFKF